MGGEFKDHFASVAAQYAQSRPTYPSPLFDWLAGQCEAHDLAWDCGAGNGQASLELARHFNRVLATDASASQIGEALPHPRIEYRVAPAEVSGLPEQGADLVVVAQALHWFDLDRFYREVERVLKPGGVVAAWSYGVLEVEGEEVNVLVQRFYHDEVGPYWPPERRYVETGYRDLAFPFPPLAAPTFAMNLSWNLEQLLGYFRSWSASAAYIKAQGSDPVAALEPKLRACWGDADQAHPVNWPLAMRVGKACRP